MNKPSQEKKTGLSDEKKLIIQKFITLGELTSSISHELKNLLLTINGYCDLMLEKTKNNDPIEEDLKKVKHAAEMSKNIFMELLNFSKITDKAANKTEININLLIEEILTLLQANKTVVFNTFFDKSAEKLILNPQKIKQVLINIIMNAVDSMNTSSEKIISITTGKMPNSFGNYIKIEDNGCGMSEEVRKNLFKPFFTTKSKGTGLGLSVCLDIMKEHNGYIQVTSTEGKGSSFYIIFLFDGFKHHADIIDL